MWLPPSPRGGVIGCNLLTILPTWKMTKPPDLKDPFAKPISIGPPKALREARLSPWWPQYRAAAQVEYDGHLLSKTWELVPRSSVPKGKNILRDKWVFDDKRVSLRKRGWTFPKLLPVLWL